MTLIFALLVHGLSLNSAPLPRQQTARPPLTYYRDQGDVDFDASGLPVDIEQVETLVAERALCRARGDYQTADSLKTQLGVLGVTIIDKPTACWYIGKRPMRPARGQSVAAADSHSLRGGPASEVSSVDEMMERYGPHGHDYAMCADASEPGGVGVEQVATINALLRDRLAAKLRRDFTAADRLWLELTRLGVTVDDVSKEWRSAGDGRGGGWRRTVGDGDDVKAVNEKKILQFVAERDAAKKARDFGAADYIRRQLRSKYLVIVDDKRRTWRVVREYGGYYRAGPPVDKALPRISGLLRKYGSLVKQGRKGAEQAAEIEARLGQLGVKLNHEHKTWTRAKRTSRLARQNMAQEAALRRQGVPSSA